MNRFYTLSGTRDTGTLRRRIVRLSIAVIFVSTVVLGTAQIAWPSGFGSQNDGVFLGNEGRQPVDLRLDTDYLKGYVSDTGGILTSPLDWSRSDWFEFSLFVGITTVLADDEEDIQSWFQENRNGTTDNVAKLVKPFGDGRYTLPAMAALYCYGHFFESERARSTALLAIESFVSTGVFTETLKHTSHKHRPMPGDLENAVWDGPSLSKANLSFPSGHAAAAFAIATVLASGYGDNTLVPPVAYGCATLCAFSRVNDNAHWVSDVILGSAIGYFTAKTIIGRHGQRNDGSLRIRPVVGGRRPGISVSYRF
jgi:membrane-associated phospholipid phosphatase